MPEPDLQTNPSRKGRWTVAIVLIGLGIGGLGAWSLATPGTVSYYATPTEVRADGADAMDRTLRLGGRVAADTLERDGTIVRFGVSDGDHTIPVRYRGDVPDTLQEDTDVIAEGELGPDGTLLATRVLAKCSSKFVDEDADPEHLGRT